MARLEDLTRGASVRGILPNAAVSVVDVQWHGSDVAELTYKDAAGHLGNELLYRDREPTLEIVSAGRPWSFDSDGELFRLASEAYRIRLAYLFDPMLAVHTSLIEPLPHQITAVYGEMLTRQPLRYLLADDPGAGKTIMTGMLLKELLARGDLKRCLVCCPGNLADQWLDEMWTKFQLPFEVVTHEMINNARTGNAFAEHDLVICRMDQLARNEDYQARLKQTEWDVVVCDEAHKMSAHFDGGELDTTKRYRLGQLLGTLTRHLLLLTATPHNGKEEEFQLFMALLDGDRFEGRFRDGVHVVDVSDLMRRMVKENMVRFDGRPLFPERRAYTVSYRLSDLEAALYEQVTNYVRDEMNRADSLAREGEAQRGNRVGFALTVLQRRLASSPEAIYQSLKRRRERLEKRLQEEQLLKRGADVRLTLDTAASVPDPEDMDDFYDEAPAAEVERTEENLVDSATAARTIHELQIEIGVLRGLEAFALRVRRSGTDCKWQQLSDLLQGGQEVESSGEMFLEGRRRKLIIFTEHRDTLSYLADRITTLLGRPEVLVTIHGSMGREERRTQQERFTQDKEVLILVATDAAGEGINLQRANLMVNYDLPWNPNRIEQRFGRIHRIGQTEVCHLWNLVAAETREGVVFERLLHKLSQERLALGDSVFDVLGESLSEQGLRKLMIEAIRYGDQPEVRERLNQVIDRALDTEHLRQLLEERALAHESLSAVHLQRIREDMERADAVRLQPHHVSSFFRRAFTLLGGSLHEREPKRYEITHVPAIIRQRDRLIGVGAPVLERYERVTFDKDLISVPDQPLAAFLCPGHPLLDSVTDLVLERHRDLLRRGCVLVDPYDRSDSVRVLVYLEHTIQDARTERNGERHAASRRMQFVELTGDGQVSDAGSAPYLDYRPLRPEERPPVEPALQASWINSGLEATAIAYAAQQLVPLHLAEVKARKDKLVQKTIVAVKDRLTKEITFWDHRAEELKLQELSGRRNARLNSGQARRRADELQARLQRRLQELEEEGHLSAQPPLVVGGAIVVPQCLLDREMGTACAADADPAERERIERLAVAAVMEAERRLGRQPVELPHNNPGYDIESRETTGRLLFIEVKGKTAGASVVTVSRSQILTALNKPQEWILAIVPVTGERAEEPRYVRQPFAQEPEFAVTSVNYDLAKLLPKAEAPS